MNSDRDLKDWLWWHRHMVILAGSLAERIEDLLEAERNGDEKQKEFFHNHFRAVLSDYKHTIEQEKKRHGLR